MHEYDENESELDEEARLQRQHDDEVANGEYVGPPCDCHPEEDSRP